MIKQQSFNMTPFYPFKSGVASKSCRQSHTDTHRKGLSDNTLLQISAWLHVISINDCKVTFLCEVRMMLCTLRIFTAGKEARRLMARLQVRCLPSVQPAWSRCPTHARASWQLRHLKQVTSTLIQSFHALEVTFSRITLVFSMFTAEKTGSCSLGVGGPVP